YTFTWTCAGDPNHVAGSDTHGTIHIGQAAVTATAGSGTFTYDGTPQSPTACAVTGAYTTGVTCVNSPASQTAAGTYPTTPTVSGADSNFSVTSNGGTLTINQAPTTATANAIS